MYPYDQYLQAVGKGQGGALYQAGFQAGINLMQQQLGKLKYFSFLLFCFCTLIQLRQCSVVLYYILYFT